MLIWVGILTIHTLLLASSPVDAAEVYGPPNAEQSLPSTQEDKEDRLDLSPKDLSDLSSPTEHALKSLPAEPGYSVIPLPAFATNRNEGYWIGGLTPILKNNAKGETDKMFVPEYLYNSQGVGHYGSLNYYGYPSDREQYHAFVWYGQKLDQGIDLGYKNVGVGGGQYILAADLTAFKDPFARFFGFGSRTSQAQETNYTERELLVKLTAGVWLTSDLALMLTERYRNIRVDDGIVVSLPRTAQQFPAIPGIQGAQVLGHGLTLRYDTRDSQLMPTKGTYVNALAEFNQNLQPEEENQWGHVVLDARSYIPHASDRMVFVSRMLFEGVFGQLERKGTQLGVPFYEQAMLGGENTLRAFGRNRYIGGWAVLANIEERVTVLNQTMFGVNVHLELAPFLDIGRVGHSGVTADHLFYKHLQLSPGVGFRALIKPTIVGRIDVAYGSDGANVFVGLDYPF